MPRAARIGDTLFGDIAVKGSFATSDQVRAALDVQSRTSGPKKKLGQIMVAMGILSSTQVKNILEIVKGNLIPGYELISEVGRGGMGVVYKARQLSMDRVVALKILTKKLQEDERFTARFLQEAKNVAKLNHENIIGAIDVGEANGVHFFVMEFVDGISLGRTLRHGKRLSIAQGIDVAIQLSRALDHAWTHKIVHRDIKPDNIMLSKQGVSKLCDYGLALAAQGPSEEKSEMAEGTPYYISPEAALGRQDLDIRSDIYSLGATLFHLISGRRPYGGKDDREIMIKHVRAAPPDILKVLPQAPPGLSAVLKKMMAKSANERYQTPQQLVQDLLKVKSGKDPVSKQARPASAKAARRRVWIPVALGVAVVLLACLLAWWAASGRGNGGQTPASPAQPGADGDRSQHVEPLGDAGEPTPEPEPENHEQQPAAVAADRSAFDAAQRWWSSNPDQPVKARDRFERVGAEFPDSDGARLARLEIALIDQLQEKDLEQRLTQLESLAADALLETNFRKAEDLYLGGLKAFGSRFESRLQTNLSEADALNRRYRTKLLTDFEDQPSEARRALRELQPRSTAAVAALLEEDVAALEHEIRQREALVRSNDELQALQTAIFASWAACEFAEAVGLARSWRSSGDAGLDGRAALTLAIAAEMAEQAEILRTALEKDKSQKTSLLLADGSKESGRLVLVSPDFHIQLQKSNRREVVSVSLSEFDQTALDELFGGPPDDQSWFGRVALFAACGHGGMVGREMARKPPGVDAVREGLIPQLLASRLENLASEEYDAILLLVDQDELESAARRAAAWPGIFATTRFFQTHRTAVLTDLRDILLDATLARGIEPLLHCDGFEQSRDGSLTLNYSFSDDAQLADWHKTTGKREREESGVKLSGHMVHSVRFEGDIELLVRCAVRQKKKDKGGVVFSVHQGQNPDALFSFWNTGAATIGENGANPGASLRGPNHILLFKDEDAVETLTGTIADNLVLNHAYDLHCSVKDDMVRANLNRNQLFSFRADSLASMGHVGIWTGEWDAVIISVLIKGRPDPAWLEAVAVEQVDALLAPYATDSD